MPARRSKTWRESRSEPLRSALGEGGERGLVGDRAPEEGGDVVLLDALQLRRDAGLAEIFLGEDVARDLAPGGGHVDAVELEDDRAVGVPDLALGRPELDAGIARLRLPWCIAAQSAFCPHSSALSRARHPRARFSPERFGAPRHSICRQPRGNPVSSGYCVRASQRTLNIVLPGPLCHPAFRGTQCLFHRRTKAQNSPARRARRNPPGTSLKTLLLVGKEPGAGPRGAPFNRRYRERYAESRGRVNELRAMKIPGGGPVTSRRPASAW